VLGLRDVLDDPDLLAPEWERKGALGAAASEPSGSGASRRR
jgi:hypothetical protein